MSRLNGGSPAHAARRDTIARLLFVGVFFVGGFSALLYQVVWQRILTFFTGSDLDSVTMIVAAFMAGMGIGSLAGGHLADRLTVHGRLMAFAACELAVGAFAAGSLHLYYDVLYVRFGDVALPHIAQAAVLFVVTLWPTTLMGMSLPLAAGVLSNDARQPARWIPILYGWNTLGAACGSLFAVALLFKTIGFSGTVAIGAWINGGCGVAVLVGGTWLRFRRNDLDNPNAGEDVIGETPPVAAVDRYFRWTTWTAMYAVAGFVSLSLEIVWFRVLGVSIKSSSFTFGYLLALYLAGLGIGALAATSPRVRAWRPVSAFLLLQAAVPLYAALSMALFARAAPWTGPFYRYLGSYGGEPPFRRLDVQFVLYCVLPIWLLGPATLMMGAAFSLLQRAVQNDRSMLGRRVGWLQTGNIAGGTAGVLVTGLVFIDRLGSVGTLRLLTLTSLLFVWLYACVEARWPKRLHMGIGVLAVLSIGSLLPSADTFWARLHGDEANRLIQGEDRTGLSVLKRDGDVTTVLVNGLGQSWLPFGGIHTALGALPALLHPNPKAIAVIGFGSGDTVFASGGRPETESIDCVEIVAAQMKTVRELERRQMYPALGNLLRDPRLRYQTGDGRAFLRKSARRYDIIEADALRPFAAYAGNLYSIEYFELLRDRLTPGGIAVTWVPTPRVLDTFVRVFPNVLVLGPIAMGAMKSIVFDESIVLARLRNPWTQHYYTSGGVKIESILSDNVLLKTPKRYGPDFDRSILTDVNRDLFPKDEFFLPGRFRAILPHPQG